MSQIKLTRSAHGEHMMCTRVYTLVQTSLYVDWISNTLLHVLSLYIYCLYLICDTEINY